MIKRKFFTAALMLERCSPLQRNGGETQTQYFPPEPYSAGYAVAITYEDTWDSLGDYLQYLAARYEVTSELFLVDEMKRVGQLCIDVYREDNPDDTTSDWLMKKGFWRRLYGGRYAKWPFPETLGTDQMAPL